MAISRYRATINGFWCRNETWDDAFEWDGKRDEIFISVNTKTADKNGNILLNFNSESELMGDTWNLPNRVQVGSASDRGGIVTGDKYPSATPWLRGEPNSGLRAPPYTIWEGELKPGEDIVLLTPTIWEWDPGEGFWDGWLAWQVGVDTKYGQRAKDIFSKIWPVTSPIFDAVSLGIQTVGTLAGLWSPLGKSMRRPIGTKRDPNNADGYLFNPTTIALNSETAEYLVTHDLQGLGNGIAELLFEDDPYLRGVYSLYFQIEKLDSVITEPTINLQRDWRWCNKCQDIFFGPSVGTSKCAAGGTHNVGTSNYSVRYGPHDQAGWQKDWSWCNKCQVLFFGPNVGNSKCAAGGTHNVGTWNYSVRYNADDQSNLQRGWSWCNKCQVLFFGPNVGNSKCAAGGTHNVGTWNYSVNYES
ncbi:hypothetical protein [Nitrosospira multiformis]|uniref:hypothetical protein n=1 Tax=Nitrosospira multiformis TaxID=1231 RepID=UPI00089921DE|nr:hypothetical protein [Nitrosospira multiformis]SEA62793.1 hypothetical protein SAMN05216411_11539 [Nitrosospira multiformis]